MVTDGYKDTDMNSDTQAHFDKPLKERRGKLLINVLYSFQISSVRQEYLYVIEET